MVAVAIQNESSWPFAFAAAQPASQYKGRGGTPNAPSSLALRHVQHCMLARHDAGGWLGPLGLCRMRRLSLHRCGRDSHGESMKASRATGLGSYRIGLRFCTLYAGGGRGCTYCMYYAGGGRGGDTYYTFVLRCACFFFLLHCTPSNVSSKAKTLTPSASVKPHARSPGFHPF